MSDPIDEATDTVELAEAANAAPRPNNSFWLDFGPLLVFFGAFHYFRRSNPDEAMLWAAGVFAVAAVVALAVNWLRHKRVSGILVFATIVIVASAALALIFDNKAFFFMKPTAMNALYGVLAIGGALSGHNLIKLLVGEAFTLPEHAWNGLAWRWGLFFFFMAGLNEVVWRNFSEATWVNIKTFGFLPLTLVFALTLIPFIRRHGGLDGLTKHET